ncbi:MAG: HipA N-terminal domain-containing protein [Sulfurimonas sp.]|jgi:serine/threonine-protein kinase HipA
MKQARILRRNILAGILTKKDDGTFSFKYDDDYLKMPEAQNISVNFPLQKEPFDSEYLFAFFFNMLSEGNIKTAQCANMKIDENDSFTRLLKTAKDDTIGSVSVEEII